MKIKREVLRYYGYNRVLAYKEGIKASYSCATINLNNLILCFIVINRKSKVFKNDKIKPLIKKGLSEHHYYLVILFMYSISNFWKSTVAATNG